MDECREILNEWIGEIRIFRAFRVKTNKIHQPPGSRNDLPPAFCIHSPSSVYCLLLFFVSFVFNPPRPSAFICG
jgi:hypothetical protein